MTDRDHSHEVEMEISLDGCSSFSFENTEQRIISSYIVLMINSSEVTDMIGNQLTNEFKTKIDANTGFGSISGSALKLKLMLDIFMQTATDVSLSCSEKLGIGGRPRGHQIVIHFQAMARSVQNGTCVPTNARFAFKAAQRIWHCLGRW